MSNITHDMQDFEAFQYEELEFIAQETLVHIIPLVRFPAMDLFTVYYYPSS